ncbi:PD-(D/E)XK motif protein [Stappia sp. BW2]|uniref:PD-(D/E)XK motif protein n=1 Tax=Stappia sp. BW2 TaxID=2592622 RepID=UPI0011DEAFF5|nr:PD-(D/E)XK motif protein [Stappia sp. BW2]TYC79872.1 PD-(D/E)XK motif protein [Stappia sp. BW2]
MTTEVSMLPPWEDMLSNYVEPGLPHRLTVRTAPGIHIFTDASASRIGARFELTTEAPAAPKSKLEQIEVNDVSTDGRRWLEISTSVPRLFESFYRLITQITNAVLSGTAPHVGLEQAVGLWDSLVEEISLLSEERQAGLFGELLLLERLLLNGTSDAVASWVGPDRQPHDFRVGVQEFEVKTTSSAKRVHTINGLDQLQPSTGCTLFLISMQLTDAGTGGRSLPELVDGLKTVMPATDIAQYDARLQTSGYEARHAAHYTRRRRLRSEMALITVEDGMPRLTAACLAALPSSYATERIGSVTYDIDVTNLGVTDGSDQFLAVIPLAVYAS